MEKILIKPAIEKFKLKKIDRNTILAFAVSLFLLFGIALIYLRARHIPLISDDYVDLLDLSDWGFFPSRSRSFFRPVVKLYFESLTPMLGMNSAGYHLLSQFLHWINSLLLFAFCRHFFRLRNPDGVPRERSRETILSAVLATAFAFSYAHSEAVYWIAATTTLLEALFILLTLHAYSRYLSSGRTAFLASALFLFALGLGAKEGVFLIVAMIPLYWFVVQGKFRLPHREVLLSWIGFWAIGAAYLLAMPRVFNKAMHGGAYAFKIGVSLLRNVQQFVFSSILWTPFNDKSLFSAQQHLLGAGSQAVEPFNAWLLLGILCFAFLVVLAWKGGFPTWAAIAMVLISTLPYALPPRHISGWMIYPYPLRVYYVIIIFFVLMLAVFASHIRLAASRRGMAVVAILLATVALMNGVRVFLRADDWIHEGHKYTAVFHHIKNRIDRVHTPILWIRVVDPTDNSGIFIRYSFPFYPQHKHRLQLTESQHPTWSQAVQFKPKTKKKLQQGLLTVFVISGTRVEVFDRENPGP